MKSLLKLAGELEHFLLNQKWRYCFIGGLANQRWGQPRTTIDVDLTILTGFGREESFIDELKI